MRLRPVTFPATLADTDRARDALRESQGVSVRDLLHVAVMQNHDVTRIASFDRGFDAIRSIERLRLEANA